MSTTPTQSDSFSERISVSRFGGTVSRRLVSNSRAAVIRNFRIRSDGALEKRCGFETVFQMKGPVRGVWIGEVGGSAYRFYVGGNTVYRQGPNDGTLTAVYYLPGSLGRAYFAYLDSELYLFASGTVLRFLPALDTFSATEGYVPLYGKNWNPTQLGRVNESRNMINNHLRVHYLNTGAATTFRLPFSAQKIDRLTIDGKTTTAYSHTAGGSTFSISAADAAGREVEVAFEAEALFDPRESTLSGCAVSVYRDSLREAVMLYGATVSPHAVFVSHHVTEEMHAASALVYQSLSSPLYLPEANRLIAGSTQRPVRALCQIEDRMLAMNELSTWSITYDADSDFPRIALLNSGVGCLPRGGATVCHDQVATVYPGGVSFINFRPETIGIGAAALVSEDIAESLDYALLQNATVFYNRRTEELWLRDPSDIRGTVWIYDIARNRWFSYLHVPANEFFERDGETWFSTDDGRICRFNENRFDDDESPIEAIYESQFFCFDSTASPKRTLLASICAETGEAPLLFTVETDREQRTTELCAENPDAPAIFNRRFSSGRFHFLRYTLKSTAAEFCRIHFLYFDARN